MKKRCLDISGGGKKCLLVLSVLSLSVQMLPMQPGWTAGIDKKSSSMQTPINLKLDESSPEVMLSPDNGAKADLTPMTLVESKPSGGISDTANGSPVLNATVSENEFSPKGPAGPDGNAAPPISIKDTKPSSAEDKLIRDARKTNIMPLALMESRDETDRKLEARFEAEKVQLTDLWNATLTRSPDIQFVTQKLLPSSAPSHTSAIMMRLLSTAMMGAMSAAYYAAPSPGTMMAGGLGGSMIQQVLGMTEAKNAKAARLSETETIMLYNMVRANADRLVENYRCYKKHMNQLKMAETDLVDLQNMARDAKMAPSEQIKTEYTLRKAQREITGIMDDVRKFRQSLTDLAGGDAIAKLDKQMDEEHIAIDPALAEAQKEGLAVAEPQAAQAAAIAAEHSAQDAAKNQAAKTEPAKDVATTDLEKTLVNLDPTKKAPGSESMLAGVKPVKGGPGPSTAIIHN